VRAQVGTKKFSIFNGFEFLLANQTKLVRITKKIIGGQLLTAKNNVIFGGILLP
jgi:hypothetical protein